MDSPTVVCKAPVAKPVVTPRLQKPIVDNRRVNSVERHIPTVPIRNKLPTACSTTSINSSCQRLGKFSLDIFQPQPKSNTTTPVTNRKSITTNNKTKVSTKVNISKVKVSSTTSNEEIIQPDK